MQTGSFQIISNESIARDVFLMTLQWPSELQPASRPESRFVPGQFIPGQFVDVALDGFFLRRPFGIAFCRGGEMGIIYKVVGGGTERMAEMSAGAFLDVMTGLGNGFDLSLCRSSAIVVGGGLGVSPLCALVERLLSEGRSVCCVLGFNSDGDVFMEDELRRMGADVRIATMDGSRGVKGTVCDALTHIPVREYDVFYTCGPRPMMKAVCALLDIPGQASLEERMGCGCGICYGCTCHTTGGPKRVCADGPVFNKEEIIW